MIVEVLALVDEVFLDVEDAFFDVDETALTTVDDADVPSPRRLLIGVAPGK